MQNRNMLRILGLASYSLLIINCGLMDIYEPDHSAPQIDIVYPPSDHYVIGSGIDVLTTTADNEAVTRVEFYVNDVHDTLTDDFEPPFTYLLIPPLQPALLGSRIKLYSKAFDERENEMISNFVYLYNQWQFLASDSDEGIYVDLEQVHIRSTNSRLDLRIQTHKQWFSNLNTTTGLLDSNGIHVAVFIDSDTNSGSGYSGTDSAGGKHVFAGSNDYSVSGIGADYMALVGYEDNGLYRWSGNAWERTGDLQVCVCVADTDNVNIGIDLDEIDNPEMIDLRIANISHGLTPVWDWLPDTSALTYTIDGRLLEE